MKYNFTKVLSHNTVKRACLSDSVFKPNIKSIKTSLPDSLEIEFIAALTASEALRLSGLIDTLTLTDIDIVIDANMQKITKFTEKLIRDYGKKNLKRGYTELQIRTMTADLSEINQLLQGKALPTVLNILSTFTPTAEITSEDISEFVAKITEFLGKL